MSSGVQSIIQDQLLNNAASAAGITIVAYDYILTFPKEVKYIWSRPWTWLSTLFFTVRYVGIYTAVSDSLSDWHHIRAWSTKDMYWTRLFA